MNRASIRSVVASLSYYRTASDRLSTLACRSCKGPLDVHQPDQDQPEQFLGTCPGCGRWYRIASSPGSGLTVLELPEFRTLTAVTPDGVGPR